MVFYVDPLFVDSTLNLLYFSFCGDGHNIGVTFDPKSIIFTSSLSPLLTSVDSYYLDTVWVGGVLPT